MQNAESNPDPTYRQDAGAKRPAQAPAARRMRDAASGRRLTPEMIAAKRPTGLPPIERGTHAPDSDDPVRRAAARIPTLDNASMAMTDNTVDVDGKGREAAAGASKWHDNVIYSNASLDEAVDTPDEGPGRANLPAGGIWP